MSPHTGQSFDAKTITSTVTWAGIRNIIPSLVQTYS